LHEFDISKGSFREIAEIQSGAPPERLVHAACADRQGRMWIFGGLTTDRKALDDLWCYNTDENCWKRVDDAQGDLPGPRYGTRLACVGDSLYLFGGSRERGPTLYDLYQFQPDRQKWTRLEAGTGEPPSPRYAPAFIAVGERIYLFGGGDGKGGYVNDLYVYEPSADSWDKLAPKGDVPAPRGCPLPFVLNDNRLYLFSGAQSAAQFGSWINGELHVYDIRKNTFRKLRSGITW
jgi:N-acetylneuraminic acid mutarotase